MARPCQLGEGADAGTCRRSAALRSTGPLCPFRVGQPEAHGMVGEAADAMNRRNRVKPSLPSEVSAILTISLLTSNLASRMIRGMRAKKNPNAVALGKLGGKARALSLSAQERSEAASKAGKARSEKLSAAERSRIAKVAVQARERKRKSQQKEKSA